VVPDAFRDVFTASAGAGGALIGLLFVAVSIASDRIFGRTAAPERTAVAGSAFTALVNAFFISLAALLPGQSLGYIVILFGVIGDLNSATVGVGLVRCHWWDRADLTALQFALRLVRALLLVVGSLAVYGYELAFGR
jgi:hypothetical protein